MKDVIIVKITQAKKSVIEGDESFYIRGKVLKETKNCNEGPIHFIHHEKLKVGKEYKISYKHTLAPDNVKKIELYEEIKVGQKIYVGSHFYISHGSDDVVGGLATITKITKGVSGGEKVLYVEVAEHPGNCYNWTQFLSEQQKELKKEFGRKKAYADPDIDTPWIEKGDLVDGKPYQGDPIW
jgi:hypothetical protein